MTFDDEPNSNTSPDNLLGWFGDSVSYFPTFFFDDTYGDFSGDSLWAEAQNLEQELVNASCASSLATTTTVNDSVTNADLTQKDFLVSNPLVSLDLPRKRKLPDNCSSSPQAPQRKQLEAGPAIRKLTGNKKGNNKSSGSNNNNTGNNKEGRWAEQLLNPCAAAITARNPSRVQHFLYVLHDLASLTGDANHRLAFHGLQALTHYLSATTTSSLSSGHTFASSNSKFFRDSLIKFNDISPWFRIPNNVANTSILQILAEQSHQSNLHILDIGVSHGVQWPTLLEELTRRPGGPPPVVRLTVIAPPICDNQSRDATPFTNGPENYDFSSKLLVFAKEMNINLAVSEAQTLCPA